MVFKVGLFRCSLIGSPKDCSRVKLKAVELTSWGENEKHITVLPYAKYVCILYSGELESGQDRQLMGITLANS
jgi:hypothetical protein